MSEGHVEGEITLREYTDKIFALNDSALNKALALNNAALEKAFALNEAAIKKTEDITTAKLATIGKQIESIEKDVKSLELSKAEIAGKASQQTMNLSIIISVIGILTGFAGILLSLLKHG